MSSPELREAWQEWRAFADELELSRDGSADCAALHARLFRLCGNHPARARHLKATRQAVRDAFDPWLGSATPDRGVVDALHRAMTACEPGWRALLGGAPAIDWDEVERVALASGLAWNNGPFWTSSLFLKKEFNPLLALRGQEFGQALTQAGTLLRVLNHPQGEALWGWMSKTQRLGRPGESLKAAVLRDAIEAGVLTPELVGQLGWIPLVVALNALAEGVCLALQRRLNEGVAYTPATAREGPAAPRAGKVVYRREVPEPFPVEQYFRKIRGSEPFLRAIAEEPLEDAHRLAFADWLEDAGHPERASFIRLQCQAEQLPDGHLLRIHLTEQAARLLIEHGDAWTAGLPKGRGRASWDFRRGLLERVTVDAVLEAEGYAKLFAAVDIRQLRQDFGQGDSFGPWSESPFLTRVICLRFGPCNPRSQSLSRLTSLLARCPALQGVVVDGGHLGKLWVQALTSLSVPAGLRELRLLHSGLDRAAARVLASSPGLGNLTTLDLTGNRLGSEAIEALASSPWLANLTTLNLVANEPGTNGVKALASSPFLKNLRSLDLSRGYYLGSESLRAEAARALARSAGLATLQVLNLTRHYDASEGVEALAGSEHLRALSSLALAGTGMSEEGARALGGSSALANLAALDLSSTGMLSPGARALSKGRSLEKLTYLDLRGNRLSDGAKKAVRERWPFALMDER